MTQLAVEAPPAPEARERILRAAERLFAEKGYAATAVHEITDAAAVNRALLYYYFADKQSLYQGVIEAGVDEFARMLERALSTPGPYAERLAALVRGHLDLLLRRRHLARVMHRCLLDGHKREMEPEDRLDRTIGRLEAFLREGVAVGELRPCNPAILARTLLGPTYVFSLWELFEGMRFTPEETARQITEMLLHGLSAHPSSG
ncbi:MAG TPA: TetR/AcrR family transcriptional regulator [Armatimonadota bacterium]|nr:TetR/AcrR family transcriptional regulator [Armatimonadota bacterium]